MQYIIWQNGMRGYYICMQESGIVGGIIGMYRDCVDTGRRRIMVMCNGGINVRGWRRR